VIKKRRWQLEMFFGLLVNEATDPETETHWWELTLDLLVKWTAGLPGAPELAEAALALRDLLRTEMGEYGPVELVDINEDTVRGICLLSETLGEAQRGMVADNAISLSQAHFSSHARFWAIQAGKAPVGFMMIIDDPVTPEYYLWRFMIAEPYQGRGYGRAAIELLIDYVSGRPGAETLSLSCGQGEGSPQNFYEKIGFTTTGEFDDDEIVLQITLD
jgi:diamine N-acetyltransferase